MRNTTIIANIITFLTWGSLCFTLLSVSCRTPSSLTNTSKDSLKTIPDTLRFTPDPFSSLVELETRFGTMKIELFFHAGEHRENFLKLIKSKYYDDLIFHRVIKNFMAQGGDPKSKNAKEGVRLGGNGPGYDLDHEINLDFFHVKGALAAARNPDEINPEKKSSGSQFYIVHGNKVDPDQLDRIERKYNIAYSPQQRELYQQLGGSPQLDMEYTVFGRVYEGFEIIDSIASVTTDKYDRPKENITTTFRIVKE